VTPQFYSYNIHKHKCLPAHIICIRTTLKGSKSPNLCQWMCERIHKLWYKCSYSSIEKNDGGRWEGSVGTNFCYRITTTWVQIPLSQIKSLASGSYTVLSYHAAAVLCKSSKYFKLQSQVSSPEKLYLNKQTNRKKKKTHGVGKMEQAAVKRTGHSRDPAPFPALTWF